MSSIALAALRALTASSVNAPLLLPPQNALFKRLEARIAGTLASSQFLSQEYAALLLAALLVQLPATDTINGMPNLMSAVISEEPEVVADLLARGADPNAARVVLEPSPNLLPTLQGQTALHIAPTDVMVRLLVAAGANVETPSSCGNRPIHDACAALAADAVEALLASGADPDARDHQGHTSLQILDRLNVDERTLPLILRCRSAVSAATLSLEVASAPNAVPKLRL